MRRESPGQQKEPQTCPKERSTRPSRSSRSCAGPTKARPHGLCLDKGYDYASTREIAARLRLTLHLRTRGEEAKAKRCGAKARRWVVERAHSWLNRFRRLLVRWEKKSSNYQAMLHLACATIVAGQTGLFG